MVAVNALPVTPTEPSAQEQTLKVLSTYVRVGTADAYAQTQFAIRSLQSLDVANEVFNIVRTAYDQAKQNNVNPETLERHDAVLESLQEHVSYLQSQRTQPQQAQQQQRPQQQTRVNEEEKRRVRYLRMQEDTIGSLLSSAERYDLDAAAVVLKKIDDRDTLNRAFEASVILFQRETDPAKQQALALLQELLRKRFRELASPAPAPATQQQQQQQQQQMPMRQQPQAPMQQQGRALTPTPVPQQQKQQQQQRQDTDTIHIPTTVYADTETPVSNNNNNNNNSGFFDNMPCWMYLVIGAIVIALVIGLVSLISGGRKKQQVPQKTAIVYYNRAPRDDEQEEDNYLMRSPAPRYLDEEARFRDAESFA